MKRYTQSFSDRENTNKLNMLVESFNFKKSNIKLGSITESVEKEFSNRKMKVKSFTYLKEGVMVTDFYKVDTLNKKMSKIKTIKGSSNVTRNSWIIEKVGRSLIGESVINEASNDYNFKESNDRKKRQTSDLKYLDKLLDYVQSELEVMSGVNVDLEYQRNNGWSEFYTCNISINEKNVGEFEFKVNSKGIFILLVGNWVNVDIVKYDAKDLLSDAFLSLLGFPGSGDLIKSKLEELKAKVPDLFQDVDEDDEMQGDIQPLFPPMGLN